MYIILVKHDTLFGREAKLKTKKWLLTLDYNKTKLLLQQLTIKLLVINDCKINPILYYLANVKCHTQTQIFYKK